MLLERIRVQEGFLDGRAPGFSPGLNVLIGPRGSGKTSVIELLRFCLGAETITESYGIPRSATCVVCPGLRTG